MIKIEPESAFFSDEAFSKPNTYIHIDVFVTNAKLDDIKNGKLFFAKYSPENDGKYKDVFDKLKITVSEPVLINGSLNTTVSIKPDSVDYKSITNGQLFIRISYGESDELFSDFELKVSTSKSYVLPVLFATSGIAAVILITGTFAILLNQND